MNAEPGFKDSHTCPLIWAMICSACPQTSHHGVRIHPRLVGSLPGQTHIVRLQILQSSNCNPDIAWRFMQTEAKQAKGEAAFSGKMVEDLSKRLAQAEHFVRQARRVQMSSALQNLLNPDQPSTWMDDMPLPVLVSTAVQVDIIGSPDVRQAPDDGHAMAQQQQQQQGGPGRPAGRNSGWEPRRSSPLATAALVSAARVKFAGALSKSRYQPSSPGAAVAGPLRQHSEDSGSNNASGMQSRNSSRQISRRQSKSQQDTADQDTDEMDAAPCEASSARHEAPTQSSHAHRQGQAFPAELVTSQRNPSLVKQIAERCATAPAVTSFVQQFSGAGSSVPQGAANQAAAIVIPCRIVQPDDDPANAQTSDAAVQDPAGSSSDSAAVLQALRDVVATRHPALSAWPQSRQQPCMYIAPLEPQANHTQTNASAMEAETNSHLQPSSESRTSRTSPINHGKSSLPHHLRRPRSGPQLSSSGTTAAAAMPSLLQLEADVLIMDDGSRPPSRPGTSSRPRTAGQFLAAKPSRARRPMTPEVEVMSDDARADFVTLQQGKPSSRSASGGKQGAVVSPQAANQFQPLPARQKPSRPASGSRQAS